MQGKILNGRYRVISTLGQGGFGETFLVQDTALFDQHCVAKQLKPLRSDQAHLSLARRLFQTEAETLHRLGEHERIPKLHAYFEEESEFFLIQEFIDGTTLDQELPLGQTWTESEARILLTDILQPLIFVHRHQVIHRDLKPANLIRRKTDGKIVLIDFGAVKQITTTELDVEADSAQTIAIGTAGYIPSEQAQGKPRCASDIYAAGMIIIQALTGRHPARLPEQGDQFLWQDQLSVSQAFVDYLNKMISRDYRDRFQDAEEAFEALAQINSPESSHSQGTTTVTLDLSSASKSITPTQVTDLSSKKTEQSGEKDHRIKEDLASSISVIPRQNIPKKKTLGFNSTLSRLGITAVIITIGGTGVLLGQYIPSPSSISQNESIDLQQGVDLRTRNTPQAGLSSPAPAGDNWIFMGLASTGDGISVRETSIDPEKNFIYQIGDRIVEARADCVDNRWFASGFGWYTPQSNATQEMLNYVCNYPFLPKGSE